MKKIILLSVLVLSGCLEKETTFKGCPEGLVYVNNKCVKPEFPPVGVVYYDLGLKGSEGGVVIITFANNSSLTCVENCAEIITPIPQGTTGSAQANAKEGFEFSGWEDFSGQVSSVCSANPCTLSVDSSFNLKPKFTMINSEPPLTGQVLMFVGAAGENIANGNALWRTDGTIEGTVLVKDPNPNPGSNGFSNYSIMSVINNILFFGAGDGPTTGSGYMRDNLELWSSNGLNSGTSLYSDLNSHMLYQGPSSNPEYLSQGSNPLGMVKKENNIIMSAITNLNSGYGNEYVYLDENKVPHQINLMESGYGNEEGSLREGIFNERVLLPNGNLIFRAYQWSDNPFYANSNETIIGTFAKMFVTPVGSVEPQLFSAEPSEFDCEDNWSGDQMSCSSIPFCSYNEELIQDCMWYDEENNCQEPYSYTIASCTGSAIVTDQSHISTIMYDDGAEVALYVRESNFSDVSVGYTYTAELRATDGVNNYLIEYTDIDQNVNYNSVYPNKAVFFQGQYYFIKQINYYDDNIESYSSYTQLVKTRLPDEGLDVIENNVTEIHKVNNNQLLYVISFGDESDGLYSYDGESSDILQEGIYPSLFINAPGKVYFRSYFNEQSHLSYMDIETNDVVHVKNVNINSFMGIVNGKLIFTGIEIGQGFEPWVSDGTEIGTFLLKELKPGSSDGIISNTKGYLLDFNVD